MKKSNIILKDCAAGMLKDYGRAAYNRFIRNNPKGKLTTKEIRNILKTANTEPQNHITNTSKKVDMLFYPIEMWQAQKKAKRQKYLKELRQAWLEHKKLCAKRGLPAIPQPDPLRLTDDGLTPEEYNQVYGTLGLLADSE